MEEVTVEYMSNDKSVRQTAELLKLVYNGETTGIKKIESANLRNAISNDLKRFHQYIKNYRDEPDLGYDVVIAKEISRSSQFAAFKRKIVRDDPVLSDKFAASLVIDACSKI